MNQGNEPVKETEIILEGWKTVINTQMHFNEMIIRARTTGVSVVMAVYGAAALAYGQYPRKFLNVFGSEFHVSTAIILFGLILLGSILCIHFFYYYHLLLGAVERAEEIDKAYANRIIDGTRLFGMTTIVSKKLAEEEQRFV